MSVADTLAQRHDAALQGHGVGLRDEFLEAARALEALQLPEEELERWAERGAALASQSLRSWEAAVEYFRVSPEVIRLVPFDIVERWGGIAERLTEELEKARRSNDIIATPLERRRNRRVAAAHRWPD